MSSGRDRLARSQGELLRALSEPGNVVPAGLQALAGLDGGVVRGLQAYRLNAQVLADKVLSQVYPRLRAGLGEDSFAAMAVSFWRQHPPQRGDLGEWGQVLRDFLLARGVEPFWADLARLEWSAHACERAPDQAFDAASLGLLASQPPAELSLCLRAGSALLTVEAAAWQYFKGTERDAPPASAAAEAVQLWVWRSRWKAEFMGLLPSEAIFMSALLRGCSLEQALDLATAAGDAVSTGAESGAEAAAQAGEAAEAAEAAQTTFFDFSAWLQAALQHGWLLGARVCGSS